MSHSSISHQIIAFFENQVINLNQISSSVYELPEDTIRNIPASIFLDFSDATPSLLIKINDSHFEKLPESVINSLRYQDLSYKETGLFTVQLNQTEIPEFLNEMSYHIHKLFSAIDLSNKKNTNFINSFNAHMQAKRNSLRNSTTNRLTFRINKQRYLDLAETYNCIWLGDLIIEIEPTNVKECFNAICWLENPVKKGMMVYKVISNLYNVSNFKQIFWAFDFSFHKELIVNLELYAFISIKIEKWNDFIVRTKNGPIDGKMILELKYQDAEYSEMEIDINDFENPLALLAKINGYIQTRSRASVSLNPD